MADRIGRVTPRESIEHECRRRGRDDVVDGCVRLVEGQPADEADAAVLAALAPNGGPAKFLDGRPHDDDYWLRVWGMRGLLWALAVGEVDAAARDAVLLGLGDEHWRVREMAAKVSARHRVGDALPTLAALRDDPVPRVRTAAARAVAVLTDGA